MAPQDILFVGLCPSLTLETHVHIVLSVIGFYLCLTPAIQSSYLRLGVAQAELKAYEGI